MSRVHGRAGLALGLLFAINTLNFYDRHILATVTEPIRKQYGFTDTQMGWLGTAFILLYAIVGVPFGRLADRYNRKLLLGIGLFFWSILTALSGTAAGFWSLFLTRLGIYPNEARFTTALHVVRDDQDRFGCGRLQRGERTQAVVPTAVGAADQPTQTPQ